MSRILIEIYQLQQNIEWQRDSLINFLHSFNAFNLVSGFFHTMVQDKTCSTKVFQRCLASKSQTLIKSANQTLRIGKWSKLRLIPNASCCVPRAGLLLQKKFNWSNNNNNNNNNSNNNDSDE